MHQLLEYFGKEGRVIRSAPLAFVTGIALVGVVLWAALAFVNSERFATLEAHIKFKDDQIAALKEQAGVIPGLIERVTALEEKLISNAIETAPPTMGKVLYGQKWAQLADGISVQEWAKSGWELDLASPPDYDALLALGPVFRPSSAADYETLKSAFEMTDLPFLEKTTPDGEKVIVWDAPKPWSVALP